MRIAAILLLVVALILYAAMMGSVADSVHSDAAGRGMAMAFGAIFGVVLWLVLAGLMVLGLRRGAQAAWVKAAAVVLVPLTAVAAAVAAGFYSDRQDWALWPLAMMPPLLVVLALWPRAGGPAAILLLVMSLSVVGLGVREILPNPAREAERSAEEKRRLEQAARTERESRESEAAAFAALGPDSRLAEYLPYLGNRAFADQALAGIQKAKTRQADAIVLIEQRPLTELTELWQWNLLATREICEAYGTAFTMAANRISKTRSDYISAAIDLEWQLPNLKWLVRSKCDLSGPLERAETNIKAVADSDRLRNFALTLSEMKSVR